jgi:hypothetical protein
LSAALRCAEKQAGAKKDGEPAAQRLAQRHSGVHVLLRRITKVSTVHFSDPLWRTSDGGILLKVSLRDNGILLGKRY